MILKFSLVISLVCYKDTDIEALVPASVSHYCLVLSCLDLLEKRKSPPTRQISNTEEGS